MLDWQARNCHPGIGFGRPGSSGGKRLQPAAVRTVILSITRLMVESENLKGHF